MGLIASGDRPYTFLPEAGDRHLQHMRQALALMRAAGDVPIDGLLASEAGRFGAGSVVFVITTSDNQSIAGPLRRAVNRGAMVTVILLDSLSFGGDTGASRPRPGSRRHSRLRYPARRAHRPGAGQPAGLFTPAVCGG